MLRGGGGRGLNFVPWPRPEANNSCAGTLQSASPALPSSLRLRSRKNYVGALPRPTPALYVSLRLRLSQGYTGILIRYSSACPFAMPPPFPHATPALFCAFRQGPTRHYARL